MFVKIEGSYINLALVHSIDLNDDGTATLWFTGADGAWSAAVIAAKIAMRIISLWPSRSLFSYA